MRKKNIILVQIDWPGEGTHTNAFIYPRHINQAMSEWEEVKSFEKNSAAQEGAVADAVGKRLPFDNACCTSLRERVASDFKRLSDYLSDCCRQRTASVLRSRPAKAAMAYAPAVAAALVDNGAGATTGFEPLREYPDPSNDGGRRRSSADDTGPRSSFKQRRPSFTDGSSPGTSGTSTSKQRRGSFDSEFVAQVQASGASSEPTGKLDARLSHLDDHLREAVESLRQSTKDGMPGLESLLTELVGIHRLNAKETDRKISDGVRKDVTTALDAVGVHLEQLIIQTVQKEAKAMVAVEMRASANGHAGGEAMGRSASASPTKRRKNSFVHARDSNSPSSSFVKKSPAASFKKSKK